METMRFLIAAAILAAALASAQRPPSPSDPDSYTEPGRRTDAWFKKYEKGSIPPNERVIRVVTRDAAGRPVARANVTMKLLATGKTETRQTLETGEYIFTGLSRTVDYEFVAESGGKTSPPRKVSQYLPNQAVSIDLRIGAPGAKEDPKSQSKTPASK
jgi:hypothetical protein